MKTAIVPIIKNKTGDSSDKNIYRPIQGWPVAFTGGICHRYLPVNTGVDNTPKSGVYRHLLAFINISLISLQITLLTVLATYYIMQDTIAPFLQHMHIGC